MASKWFSWHISMLFGNSRGELSRLMATRKKHSRMNSIMLTMKVQNFNKSLIIIFLQSSSFVIVKSVKMLQLSDVRTLLHNNCCFFCRNPFWPRYPLSSSLIFDSCALFGLYRYLYPLVSFWSLMMSITSGHQERIPDLFFLFGGVNLHRLSVFWGMF